MGVVAAAPAAAEGGATRGMNQPLTVLPSCKALAKDLTGWMPVYLPQLCLQAVNQYW